MSLPVSHSSDPMFEKYADLDFSSAKPVAKVPVLARLQAEQGETNGSRAKAAASKNVLTAAPIVKQKRKQR